MLIDTQDIITEEISNELRLLTGAIIVKLSGVFKDVSFPMDEDKIAKIFNYKNFIRFSLLIPKAFEHEAFFASVSNKNVSKYSRNILNYTLSAIKKELSNIVDYRFLESNLHYTGFSISPFGFTLEIPKNRLIAVKLRKIAVEIIASLSLEELRSHAICKVDGNLKIPSDLVFAALRRRRDIAQSLTMPHNEYDIDEIEEQLCNILKELQKNFNKETLIAS